jgi:hypothetical protein
MTHGKRPRSRHQRKKNEPSRRRQRRCHALGWRRATGAQATTAGAVLGAAAQAGLGSGLRKQAWDSATSSPDSWWNEPATEDHWGYYTNRLEHHRLDEEDSTEGDDDEVVATLPTRTKTKKVTFAADEAEEEAAVTQPHRPSLPPRIPNSYPPLTFSATPIENYEDWQKTLDCWIEGEGGQLPASVIGPRALTVLRGKAAIICRKLKAKDVKHDGGLQQIYETLESSPLIKELKGDRIDKAQKEFMKIKRKSGESMDSYLATVDVHREAMEDEDAGLAMGERFFVGYVLDHAELTMKDRALVLTSALNTMTVEAIFPALRRLGPLLSGTVPIGQSTHDKSGM